LRFIVRGRLRPRKQSMIALVVKFIGAACRRQPAPRPRVRSSLYFKPGGTQFVAILVAGLVVVCCAVAGNCRAADTFPSPEQLVTGFGNAPNHNALNRAAHTDTAALRTAALAHLADKDPATHYAAVYALAMTADNNNGAAELVRMLMSSNVDERLLSAGTLAGLGDKRALPVLIAALDQRDELSYRLPLLHAYEFAQRQLLWFTNQDFGLKAAQTLEEIAATKPAWERWWQAAGDSLHYDRPERKFVP
jgi:hypothetical protein